MELKYVCEIWKKKTILQSKCAGENKSRPGDTKLMYKKKWENKSQSKISYIENETL